MPNITFQTLTATRDGINASTGKQTEVAFNENFALVKSLFEALFNIAGVTVTSEQITQLKADTSTNPYTLYYSIDPVTSENPTWIPLIVTNFANLKGNPTDNIALKTILDSKGSSADTETLKTQMTAALQDIADIDAQQKTNTTNIGANIAAINEIRNELLNVVHTQAGDTLFIRYVADTNTLEYSVDGVNYIDINSLGTSFKDISGNASDNQSIVDYVGSEIQKVLSEIARAYVSSTDLENHTGNFSNPHNVTKEQLGLGNVENYSLTDMPIPASVQRALDDITGDTPPVICETPAAYRIDEIDPNYIYFTSNGFENE